MSENAPEKSCQTAQGKWAEIRAEYVARYPVADPEQPLVERIRQDERTLAAAIRERSTRQYLTQ